MRLTDECTSGITIDRPSEYSIRIRLTRLYHADNIGLLVRLNSWYTNWIFGQHTADPTVPRNIGWAIMLTLPLNKHSDGIRLIRQYKPLNIGCPIRLNNWYTNWIFSPYLANPTIPSRRHLVACHGKQVIHTLNISVCIRLIQLYHTDNIGWPVRLNIWYINGIFSPYLANLTVPPTDYWMACQAKQLIDAQIEYWVRIRLIQQ